MILSEEFNRQKITEIKDKLVYDIGQINKGAYLRQSDIQTDYMKEILNVNYLVQGIRNKNIYNNDVKKLEREWSDIYKLVKEYNIAVKKFNASHKEKLQTFEDRTGGTIYENIKETPMYFPY